MYAYDEPKQKNYEDCEEIDVSNERVEADNAIDEVATAEDYDDVVAMSFPASDPPPSVIVAVKCTSPEDMEKLAGEVEAQVE